MKLTVTNVAKAFGGLQVLDGVTFAADQSEIFGVIGPNGAGKTTLFNLITGFVKPDRGSIQLDGLELVGKGPHQIARRGVVRTFQVVKPFAGLSVLENVMVAALSRGASTGQARQDAKHYVDLLELSPWQDQPARTLPLPGRKRLEMARALAAHPKFLLLDEVMGGLRPNEVRDFINLIRTVHLEGVGLVIIEHIMTAIMELCDRLIVLNHGKPIAEGEPKVIVQDPAVIKAYLGEEYAHA